ncbi:DUF2071 domain-containing protein [Gemmatimonas sp.]|uniref:YqjF family protein n=1 Tax=Gemmatimonas sp. TaxID=1962908 RepID=UPI0025C3F09A|nr:DUF2071 domain-containing protein [Gemmatimonas sp.]MCA2989987.1 DUF2071 domain-containing protein [Gemmatimonas sp.]
MPTSSAPAVRSVPTWSSAPPGTPAVGAQQWRDLLFLHWPAHPAAVQATLPPGLSVDTLHGDAWVGIVPFAMARVRPRFLPPVPWLSWFLELNVRTYVRDRAGNPGVWFYSLDCNQPVAVVIARTLFHLPYQHAHMEARRRHDHGVATLHYQCQRRGQAAPPWQYTWSTRDDGAPAMLGSLEHFLVERYALYCADARQRLYRGTVSHAPYRIHTPAVHTFDTGPATLAGFTLEGPPVSVLAAQPVNVTIHALRPHDLRGR